MHIVVDQQPTSTRPLLEQGALRLALTPADSSPELSVSLLLETQPTGTTGGDERQAG